MADQKQEVEIKAKHFWLNPSVKVDGVYKVHVNIEDTQGRLKYNERPPHRLTLAEKMIYAPELITDEEKKILSPDHPFTNLQEIKPIAYGQFDRYLILNKHRLTANTTPKTILRILKKWEQLKSEASAINRDAGLIKKQNTEYLYIGNSEPVAMGISAYFFKKNPHDDSPTSSLLSMLQRGERLAINSWYKEYYKNQIATEKKLNEAKTIAQGRLYSKKLKDTFKRDHLVSEKVYYQESEGFYNLVHCEDEHTAKILREYAEGYLAWVDKKITSINIIIFPSKYNEAQLNKIADRLVSYDLIRKNEKSKFVSLFSDKPQGITWNDKIRGSMPALFNLMDKITRKKIQAKHLKPFVKTASGNVIHDQMANINRANVKMVREILNGL